MVLPVTFLCARAVAEVLICLVALMFLARQWALRDWSWLRPFHVRLLFTFWAWLLLCTLIAGRSHAIGEAVSLIRLFLFATALEFWVLRDHRHGRWLRYVFVAIAAVVIIESWQQYFLGTNIFGDPRWGSGVLTGPFWEPRAGGVLEVVYFVAFLPPAMLLMQRPRLLPRCAGMLLLIGTLLTMAVIGQRMPMILVIFGLCIAGLLLRHFRLPMLIALGALVAGVAAARLVSPITYTTLVTVFLRRMDTFWSQPYGLIYQRAATMVQAHPWIGLGFDGFRDNCADPRYMRVLDWLPVTDIYELYSCTIHPHNFWLQIATDSGLVGVALFATLCIAWLIRIGHRVTLRGRPIQAALFVTLCVMLWPIASTTALWTVPNAGWLFLIIGWGLAEQSPLPTAMPAR